MPATPTLKRYKIRATFTIEVGEVGTSGPDALERWRRRGPYESGRPTSEAELMLHLLEPDIKARAKPEVTRVRRHR